MRKQVEARRGKGDAFWDMQELILEQVSTSRDLT